LINWLKQSHNEPQIELNGTNIPIILRRHRTAKRLTLRMAPDGSAVQVTLPHWAPSSDAVSFAHSRSEWLAKQHARIPIRCAPQAGGALLFRGEKVIIAWQENAPRHPTLQGANLHVGGTKEGLEARIRRWLEREALILFEADLRDYLAAADLEPVPVGLSRAQKRWGSCSDGGASGVRRIRINWRLVQAPDYVRRSVVAHEVAHLVHFDHSPAFHALLDDIYESDIHIADRWLKENGRSLYSAFG